MRRALRWTGRGLLLLLLLLVVAGVAGWIWQLGSLPESEGEIALEGLTAPVTVTRDADGVPTIRAESEADAIFALGYVHAQDRLFQMDFTRRLGAGRLSEVVGESTVRLDRIMRTLGLYRVAQANLSQLSPAARAALDDYAAGVNAFLDSHEGPWPFEFYVLGYDPEPWHAADSLVWGRLMALQLSGNYSQELLRARLAAVLTPEEIQQLYPDYPADGPIATEDLAALETRGVLRDLADALPWSVGPKSASNAWAVAPAHSATGGALLANDPHLSLQEPGYWYLARIETPTMTMAGATAPGVPYMVIGHNGSLAWSFTTTHSDTQDLFVETIDPADPTKYLTREGPRAFKTREETLQVAGGEPLVFTVRETYHGPVMSDAVAEADDLLAEGQALALAWPALLSDDRSGEALYRLNRAEGVPQAIAVLRDLHAPQQSMILADDRGRIALLAPGRVPIRGQGDGSRPVPGAEGLYDWIGFIPYEDLPRLVEPQSGILVTANNKIAPDDYPYLIAKDWYWPWRAERITEVLRSQDGWTVEGFSALQNDSVSVAARDLLPRLLAMVGDKPEARAALDLLAAWDFAMEREQAAPLIYNAWIRALEIGLVSDELGPLTGEVLSGNEGRIGALLGPGSLFCDDRESDVVEDCAAIVDDALDEALADLVRLYGEEPADWRWGDAHVARFDHPLLRFLPVGAGLAAYELEADGGQDTVNRGGMPFSPPLPEAFRDRHGPGLRAIFDLADLDRSRFVIATGQSTNLLSEYYGNFAERWRDGETVLLVGSGPDEGETLVLKPPE